MKHFTKIILLFCLFSILPAHAAQPDIYIHNRLLSGEVIKDGNEFYVQGEELKKLLKTDFSWDAATGNIIINGSSSTIKIRSFEDGIFVPLIALTRAMGYEVIHNQATGILDIFEKKQPEPVQPPGDPTGQTTIEPDGQSINEPGNHQTQDKEDTLIVIEKRGFSDIRPGITSTGVSTRFIVDVINGRYSRARNVKVLCILRKADGSIYARQEVKAGDIEPGKRKEVIFFFSVYPTTLEVLPIYEVRSD